ncbi:hypothetical protein [Nocardioides sp. L-11A]|uniref:hypothetical protein n=1 Tax=Nocardioides sp. L-11A TaxID=3043848 RepID=UPI00249B81FE|nr:hypothetical protein QJ852_04715 [Nocardioides sp. L-11A]
MSPDESSDRRDDLVLRTDRFAAVIAPAPPTAFCACEGCSPSAGGRAALMLAGILHHRLDGDPDLTALLDRWSADFPDATRRCQAAGADWRVSAAILNHVTSELWLVGKVSAHLGDHDLRTPGGRTTLGPTPVSRGQCLVRRLSAGVVLRLSSDYDQAYGPASSIEVTVSKPTGE